MATTLTIVDEIRTIVYTKTTWAGSWVEQPLFEATNIASQAAPGHSSAVLRWRYGKTIQPKIGTRPADKNLTTIARGAFLGSYVKIVLDTDPVDPLTWYGVIQDNSDNTFGRLDGTTPAGVETYTAFGLTWFLDQSKPITQSVVKQGATAEDNITIERAIPFNGGTDGSKRATRVSSRNYDQTLEVFTDRDNSDPPWAWTASNAIEYLLTNFPPKDVAGDVLIPFELHSTALNYLRYDLPYTDYAGMSLWQIFNKVIDRRRALAGTLSWNRTR